MKGCRIVSTDQPQKKSYQSVWRTFNKFFIRLDRKPKCWENCLTLFVGYLVECKKQSSTIKSYISAIKAVLLDNKIKLNPDQYLLTSLTKACRLVNDRVHCRRPICKGILLLLLKQVAIEFSAQPYLTILYTALLSTAYFGLFRVSELTATPSGHAVRVSDVFIGTNKRKFLFVLHSSKTHGKNSKPQKIKISSSYLGSESKPRLEGISYCPYAILQNYRKIRPRYSSISEQFFVFRDRSPVAATHFRKTLKLLLKKANFNARLYDTHSMRAGRSLDLLKYGLSVETIKTIGRWTSNVVFTYLKN